MTVEIGFVRDLQDHPFDETIRDIFGDWLEEQGEANCLARGRLLRVQSQLARWVPDLHKRRELQREEESLLTRYGSIWTAALVPYTRQRRFRAGLVDITLDAGMFLTRSFVEAAEQLFDSAWIGRVHLEMGGPRADLGSCPALARVRQLDLHGAGFLDGSLEVLLGSPHLTNLVVLDLSNNRLTDASARLLAQANLPRLRELDLRNNRLTASGVRILQTEKPGTRLEVHGNPVPPEILRETVGDDPRRLVNSVGMEFVLVPAGVFLMGSPDTEPERSTSEGPIHEVELTQPFYLGRYPVTQRQFEAVMGNNPAHFTAANLGGPDHPVEMVTWSNASAFSDRLSQLDAETLAGRVYRLPTEAQWEHACRAGTLTPFAFGSVPATTEANFDGRHPFSGGVPGSMLGHTSIVGAYACNAFGLYDMHGNVWEWCADYYDERYYSRRGQRRDPAGPRTGTRVATRGGSWSSHASACRSASRDYWYGPHYCRDNIGFRVASAVAPVSPSR